jgi:hypothetical protein
VDIGQRRDLRVGPSVGPLRAAGAEGRALLYDVHGCAPLLLQDASAQPVLLQDLLLIAGVDAGLDGSEYHWTGCDPAAANDPEDAVVAALVDAGWSRPWALSALSEARATVLYEVSADPGCAA